MQTVGFSQLVWISTNNNWGNNAEETIKNQHVPFTRINLTQLQDAPVDWEKLENSIYGESARTAKKAIFPHVYDMRDFTIEHFKDHDRGKLIMACGTGKTITALKIAEKQRDGKGLILFLVPSIALLGQTLKEWTGSSNKRIHSRFINWRRFFIKFALNRPIITAMSPCY